MITIKNNKKQIMITIKNNMTDNKKKMIKSNN